MVAKFREKCYMSKVTLDQLKRQMSKINKSDGIEQVNVQTNVGNTDSKDSDPSNEPFYENIEYNEENVQFIIFDPRTELIEETDTQDKSPNSPPLDENDDIIDEDQTTYNCTEINSTEVCICIDYWHNSVNLTGFLFVRRLHRNGRQVQDGKVRIHQKGPNERKT